MGVPGFYRWAVRKVRGLRQTTSNAASQFDNLYLDFNGVVHSCIDDWTNQENEAALFALVEAEVLVILSIIRPRLMLYVALDGVAPRAKLNQQRSRRFRAGKAMEEAVDTLDGVIDTFDRNAITPGTEFMARLSSHLCDWAAASAGVGGALQGATIVISSDTDPGEGEHKIMEVIRNRPATESHCLCSNDADLVFLGLASSAKSIHLLRAKPDNARGAAAPSSAEQAAAPASAGASSSPPENGPPENGDAAAADDVAQEPCGSQAIFDAAQAAVLAVEVAEGPAARKAAWLQCEAAWAQALALALAAEEEANGAAAAASCDEGASSDSGRYELLSIGAVRDWLASQFPRCSVERVAADFVAMCCLAGNDFLPHIEVLDIYNGGLDLLMKAYCALSPAVAGHLVNKDCTLALPLWQRLLSHFSEAEAEALLQLAGLGRGPRRPPPYRGLQPPPDDWDGLSVVLSNVPARAEEGEVLVAMRKQGSFVRSVHAVHGRGPRSPQLWLVRFEDATSAVKSLVATRRIRGARVYVSWTRPEALNLKEPPAEPFGRAEWRRELEGAVLETVEYWLGEENLQGDDFLRRHVRARPDRFVPIRVLATFNRMRVWMQDIPAIARVLRRSSVLEVQGDGDDAAVRALVDYSVRRGEGPETVARQQEAMALVRARDYARAAHTLRADYYRCRAGPEAAGAPDQGDVDAVEHFRSRAFLTGVEWVVRYYVQGCPSWSWFYPAHYPPLCVSLARATEEPLVPPPLHAPFNPELQLLAVLPPQSAALVPEPLRHLLTSPESPVIDFYPTDFEIDLKEGDKEWQAIVLLPFVDEGRLRRALEGVPAWIGRQIQFEDARAFQVVQDSNGTWSVSSWPFSPGKRNGERAAGPPGRDCACVAS